VETRLLHFLVEERRQTVDEKTRANLRLTDCLKLYFPQVLRWFDDVTSPVVGDLLQRWGRCLMVFPDSRQSPILCLFGQHV